MMSSEELGDISRAYVRKLLLHFVEQGLSKGETVSTEEIRRPPDIPIAYITVSKPERFAGVWQVNDAGCKRVTCG